MPREKRKSLKKYVFERDRHSCRYCAKELEYDNCTLDHYLPRSKGGSEAVYNLVLSCGKCNKLKKDFVPEDWKLIVLQLFKQAGQDGLIYTGLKRIKKQEIVGLTEKMEKLEDITNSGRIFFQGSGYRLNMEGNLLKKISVLSWTDGEREDEE